MNIQKRVKKLEINRNGVTEASCCDSPNMIVSLNPAWKGKCGNCRNKLAGFFNGGEYAVVWKDLGVMENENQ